MRLFFCGSLPSACISDCSARSLRSALNVLKSVSSAENAPLVSAAPSALPVVPLSKPCPCPELYAVSAAINLVLSSVKSRSTRMFVASDTSAIKSAGCIFVPTNFFAASTDRSICSGSIAEKSKKSSINRRSRASSDGAACFPERSSVPAATPDTVASAAPAVCSSSTFSKSKVEISCFFPSSKTVKSPFFRSRTRFPLLATTSRTRRCKTRSFSSVTTVAAAAWPSNIAESTSGRCARRISSESRSSSRTSAHSVLSYIRREYSEPERNRSRVRLHRRDRKALSQTQAFSRRARQAHARAHRATEPQTERVHHRHRRTCSRAGQNSRIGTFCAARPQRPSRPRPAAWHSHFPERQHLHQGHSNDGWFKNSERFHSTARRRSRRPAERSRRRDPWQDQHARICIWGHIQQPA